MRAFIPIALFELCRCSLEELILLAPYNYAHHVRYADVQYTIGGMDHIEIARKHYQQAEELKPGYARALYGMCLCVSALGGGKKPREDKAHMSNLFEFTQSKLELAYKKSEHSNLMTRSADILKESLS